MGYTKVTEKKWFQHFSQEQLGSVVFLVGIEEDDDMVLFHFSDGSKCNVEFIGALNDKNAFNNGMIMAEVSNPQNIWRFDEKVVIPKTKRAIDQDGVEWEIPDPYYDPKGEKGPQQEVKKTIGIPPALSTKTKLEKFGISVEEKPQTVSIPEEELVAVAKTSEKNSVEPLVSTDPGVLSDHNKNINANNGVIIPSGSLKLMPIGAAIWTIDANEIDKIKVVDGDKEVQVLTKDLLDSSSIKESPKKYQDDPVNILVQKCKKKEATMNIRINALLPGKSIYNLIQEEYDEQDLDTFFEILIDNLDIKTIKNSIKLALKSTYSGTE